jgi:hypothetical protein
LNPTQAQIAQYSDIEHALIRVALPLSADLYFQQ